MPSQAVRSLQSAPHIADHRDLVQLAVRVEASFTARKLIPLRPSHHIDVRTSIRRARVIPTPPARRSSARSRPARPARTRDREHQDRRGPAARNDAWCHRPRAFRDSARRSLPPPSRVDRIERAGERARLADRHPALRADLSRHAGRKVDHSSMFIPSG
jgi:hypothetical protein